MRMTLTARCLVPCFLVAPGLPQLRGNMKGRIPWALCCHGAGSSGALSPFSQAALAVEHHPAVHGRPSRASALHQEHPAWRLGDGAQIHDALGKDSSSQPPQHSRSAQVRHEGGAKGGTPSQRLQAQKRKEKLGQKGGGTVWSEHHPQHLRTLGFSILNCTWELMSQALYPGLCELYSHYWRRSFGR